jgi:hypothetical protein
MTANYKDFIATYTNVYPEGYCEHLISEFECLTENGAGYNRQKSEGSFKHHKNDLALMLNVSSSGMEKFKGLNIIDTFFEGLQNCYDDYLKEFSILNENKINATCMKMQRTNPGGGYHTWHFEQNSGPQTDRVLVYSLYLNTLPVESAGETEFLYQQLRIPPVKNTMIIWPAAFTHTHRGNTVFGNASKYIVTGWFIYE